LGILFEAIFTQLWGDLKSLPIKSVKLQIPIRPDKIIQTGILYEKSGESIIHIHARNPVDQTPSSDFQIFRKICQGLINHPLHFDFVMGLRGDIPATIENLIYLKNSIPRECNQKIK